jgi:hypothetical protein
MNSRYRFETFSFYDADGIARHLTRMAQRGWMLTRIAGVIWIYRRIEPKKLSFTVTYFPRASAFDPGPSRELLEYRDMCAHTGWKQAAAAAQMQIFYNEQPDATPVETDPALRLSTLHRAAKQSFLPAYLLLLCLSILNLFLVAGSLRQDPVGFLCTPVRLLGGFVWTLEAILCSAELIGYAHFYRRASKAAAQGAFAATRGFGALQRTVLLLVCVTFLWWLAMVFTEDSPAMRISALAMVGYMAALLLLVNGLKALLKRRGVSAGANRAATITASFVFSFVLMGVMTSALLGAARRGAFTQQVQAQLPLTLETLGISASDDAGTSLRLDSATPLAARTECSVDQNTVHLSYAVTHTDIAPVYDVCRDALLLRRKRSVLGGYAAPQGDYIPIDPTFWQAGSAYRIAWGDGTTNDFLLLYPDRIVELSLSWTPTAAQMQRIAQTLGGV